MYPSTITSLLLSSGVLFLGLTTAFPVAMEKECQPRIICVDSINACGIRYGGCYDVCDRAAKPVAPACPSTTKPARPTPSVNTCNHTNPSIC
ncbi:uncharacterized protein C8A04DRAFT_30814 [Dichotomopilus funicola]|uniref:Uncharacterized protein n=1 Tax=Dichotomopilus funicola TaxID=1934379 RepID=A0AAN6UZ66_9PEZI|nr:hypothetical protein C8A04DRAFT_30814 [Dichotomopilus funicola]